MVRVTFWTALFLILLRVAIGWHFFFEGVGKVRSHLTGPTDTSKPFSSEGYFRNAPGPLAEQIRSRMANPDQRALSLLTVKPIPEGQDPAKISPRELMPDGLKQEWERYYQAFLENFSKAEEPPTLTDAQKAEAERRFGRAQDDVVNWLRGLPAAPGDPESAPTLTVDRKLSNFTDSALERPVSAWVAEYQFLLRQLDQEETSLVPKSTGVIDPESRKSRLRSAANLIRNELIDGLDAKASQMQAQLAEVFKVGLPTPAPMIDSTDPTADETLLRYLTFQPKTLDDEGNPVDVETLDPNDPVLPESVSDDLTAYWQKYADAYATNYGYDPFQKGADGVDRIPRELIPFQQKVPGYLWNVRVRFGRWLADRNPETGTPLTTPVVGPKLEEYREKVAALADASDDEKEALLREIQPLRAFFQQGIEVYSKDLERSLDKLRKRGQGQATVEAPESLPELYYEDRILAWVIMLTGACLMIGFLTRGACTVGAIFLLMTYLAVPPFPWLPEVPGQEGTYFFVNKNMIEMLALAVLATLPTGRWLGVDGLIVATWKCCFGRRRKDNPPTHA